MDTKKKTYIIIIVFAIITVCLTVFLIYPLLRDIQQGAQKILSDKRRVTLIAQETKELYDFKKNYKNYESHFQRIDQLFTDSKNPIDFITFLENASSESNVTSHISLVPVTEKETLDTMPVIIFQISAQGTMLHMLTFIEKLEEGPYIIRIQNINIKKMEDPLDPKKVTTGIDASFSIKVVTK